MLSGERDVASLTFNYRGLTRRGIIEGIDPGNRKLIGEVQFALGWFANITSDMFT